MPFVAPKGTSSTNSGTSGRTTMRPPWVKDDGTAGLKPTTKTSVPWAKKSTVEKENGEKSNSTVTDSKKPSANTSSISTKKDTQNSATSAKTTKPDLTKKMPEPIKKIADPPKKIETPIKKVPDTTKKITPTTSTNKNSSATAKSKEPSPSSSEEEEETEEEESEEEYEEESGEEETEEDASEDEEDDSESIQLPTNKFTKLKATPLKKQEEEIPAPPPLPSLVPKAPPPPPPPLGAKSDKRALTEHQKAALDRLKTRPRRRPDWSEMMKEVETGRKLRHVECNDRSQPILTCKSMTKVDDKFIYETEKDTSHNKLLKQIQQGIKLKPTQTKDRSRPFLEGLRKFRRQMTIEEQLQKSQSKVNMLAQAPSGTTEPSTTSGIVAALSIEDPSGDELDDIDKIRDDLQSTKQMLALELRNREAQERENKKLLAKIVTLEAELEREKSREKNLEYGSNVIVATMDALPSSEQAYVNSLKDEAEGARKSAKDLETKYHTTGELLDQAKSEIEEQKRQIQLLERKLAQALQGGGSLNGSRRASDALGGRDSSPELDMELSESDPDEPEEKKNERREHRLVKEIKVLRKKLTNLKVKQEAAKKEKLALKQAMKKNHIILKEENKKFKKLEKEVQKMAASMNENDEEDDEDAEEKEVEEDEEPAEVESEDESEEESEESESEESEAGTESESEAEDAPNVDKKKNLEPRVKKHESRLSAMKKCNVLLQANVDNIQDEITQVRSKAANLQNELDSVLKDLGF